MGTAFLATSHLSLVESFVSVHCTFPLSRAQALSQRFSSLAANWNYFGELKILRSGAPPPEILI